MGGENSAIQRVASKISDEIFSVFKWKRTKREDMNWDCGLEHHNKKTHPSDVVFYYTDPYEEEIVYLNTDLKSYGEKSIAKGGVEGALQTLSLAVECANSSMVWRKKYLDDETLPYNVKGLLFLYNHDHLYHKDFYKDIMSKVDLSDFSFTENHKLYLLDPHKIADIINISFDITNLIGRGKLPNKKEFSYYYPDLSLTRLKHTIDNNTAATVELLTSPYIIIKHNQFEYDGEKKDDGYVIYYNQPGNNEDEFVYFFD
ncbi:TPA: hypothetical protein PXS10_001076, partial [Yersinia enterocolitica]|nr:hypothetical protein [Yersinia enterocolitica]